MKYVPTVTTSTTSVIDFNYTFQLTMHTPTNLTETTIIHFQIKEYKTARTLWFQRGMKTSSSVVTFCTHYCNSRQLDKIGESLTTTCLGMDILPTAIFNYETSKSAIVKMQDLLNNEIPRDFHNCYSSIFHECKLLKFWFEWHSSLLTCTFLLRKWMSS